MQTLEFIISQQELDELDALAAQVARTRGSLTREAVRNACTGYWFMTSGGVPKDAVAAREPADAVLVQVDLRDREIVQLDKLAASEESSRAVMLRRCVRHLLAYGAAVTPGAHSATGKKAQNLRRRNANNGTAFLVRWTIIALASGAFYLAVRWLNGG